VEQHTILHPPTLLSHRDVTHSPIYSILYLPLTISTCDTLVTTWHPPEIRMSTNALSSVMHWSPLLSPFPKIHYVLKEIGEYAIIPYRRNKTINAIRNATQLPNKKEISASALKRDDSIANTSTPSRKAQHMRKAGNEALQLACCSSYLSVSDG